MTGDGGDLSNDVDELTERGLCSRVSQPRSLGDGSLVHVGGAGSSSAARENGPVANDEE